MEICFEDIFWRPRHIFQIEVEQHERPFIERLRWIQQVSVREETGNGLFNKCRKMRFIRILTIGVIGTPCLWPASMLEDTFKMLVFQLLKKLNLGYRPFIEGENLLGIFHLMPRWDDEAWTNATFNDRFGREERLKHLVQSTSHLLVLVNSVTVRFPVGLILCCCVPVVAFAASMHPLAHGRQLDNRAA